MRDRVPNWGYIVLVPYFLLMLDVMRYRSILVGMIGLAIGLTLVLSVLKANSRQWFGESDSTAGGSPAMPPKQVAELAMRRVGNRSYGDGLRLLDIGLLSYDGGTQPKVIRAETVPAYATSLRPFIVINVANAHDAHFTLRFQLVDQVGRTRFLTEERFHFQRGKNFFTPHNWLPMGDDEPGGNWSMHVSISDQPLARHDFAIAPDTGAYFRTYLRPDGEIDEWLSKSATSVPTDSLSLDELIGDQGNQSHESRSR